jgi:hypothetical protein
MIEIMDVAAGRLLIRDLRAEDLAAMADLWTDRDVGRFMGTYGPRSAAETAAWLEEAMRRNRAQPRFAHNAAIIVAGTGECAGWIGCGKSSEPVGEYDFGYALRPACRGHGYAREGDPAAHSTLLENDISQHNAGNGYLVDGRPLVVSASGSGMSVPPTAGMPLGSGTRVEYSAAMGNGKTGILSVHNVYAGWGYGNAFRANHLTVNGPGYGIYVPGRHLNTVLSCDNTVTGAQGGLSNIACSPA